jgi:glycosyltransferase involved in cell wall biosynthesis
VQALLSKASVGILTFHHLPNHDDCRPNKLFEYMSAGLPIVGSNIQSWIEFLADVDNVTFVDPLSPTAIREAILALLDDPVRCAEMGERGRKAVLDQFNWDHEAQKLLNLYNELLS